MRWEPWMGIPADCEPVYQEDETPQEMYDAELAMQALDAELATLEASLGPLDTLPVNLSAPSVAKQEAPECPEGYYWNGRQCLKHDNLLRPTLYEREAL